MNSCTTSTAPTTVSNVTRSVASQPMAAATSAHPITTTKMGSRRIFSAQFKLQVLDSYRMDSDCKGNQRATARKYGIHRRQIQKWLQCESNLRSSVVLNNNNNNNNNSTNANTNCNGINGNLSNNQKFNTINSVATATGSTGATTTSTTAAEASVGQRFSENDTKTAHHRTDLTKNLIQTATQSTQQLHEVSLDVSRHNVATNIHMHNNGGNSATNCYANYKNAANATVTGFAASTTSSTSLSQQSFSAASSYTVAHSTYTIAPASFAPQQPLLRIVPSSFLMPSSLTPANASTTNAITSTPSTGASSMLSAHSSLLPPTTSSTSLCDSPAFTSYPHHHLQQQPLSPYHSSHMLHLRRPYDILADGSHVMALSERYVPDLRSTHNLTPMVMAGTASPGLHPPTALVDYEPSFHTSAFRNLYAPSANMYHLYGSPSYLPNLAAASRVTEIPSHQSATSVEDTMPMHRSQSPIDLTTQSQKAQSCDSDRLTKLRFPLSSPPGRAISHNGNKIDDKESQDITNFDTKCDIKPWDLSRKRKFDNDDDEGISVTRNEANGSNKSADEKSPSSTPVKMVKLFKPYLMSSDDDDEDEDAATKENAAKKFLASDGQKEQKDPIIWSNHPFYESIASSTSSNSPNFHSPTLTSHSDSLQPHWPNHGSPVSGYGSASSTSPAPTTVSSFSDDFNQTTGVDESSTPAISSPTMFQTKYMVPRRHILEKWSHEEVEEYSHQTQLMIVA